MIKEPDHYRAGDTVRVPALNETWVLSCDEQDGYVYPAGWPFTCCPRADVELVERATDEERLKMLRDVCVSVASDPRPALARQQLGATHAD